MGEDHDRAQPSPFSQTVRRCARGTGPAAHCRRASNSLAVGKDDSCHCAVLGWQHHRHHRPHRSRSPVSSTRADHSGGKSRRRRRQSRLGSGRESRPRRLHTADKCRCPFRGTSRLPQPSLRCSRRFFRGRHFRQRAQCAPGRAFEGHQVFAGTGGQGEGWQHDFRFGRRRQRDPLGGRTFHRQRWSEGNPMFRSAAGPKRLPKS